MALGSLADVPLTEHVPDASGAVCLHVHRDLHVWTWAAAVAIAGELRRDLLINARTRLLVSGDAMARPVCEALSRAPLDWRRVDVGLTDERWLQPDDPDSRATAVRRALLREHAACARFETLTLVGRRIEDAVATANAHAQQQAQVVLLTLGDDGRLAGLHPPAVDYPRAFASRQAYVATGASMPGDEAPWARRITLTPEGIARARTRVLLLRGDSQRRQLLEAAEMARADNPTPLQWLQRSGLPLLAHWCP